MGNGFDQEDPLGILDKKPTSKKKEDPLGIFKKKALGGVLSKAGSLVYGEGSSPSPSTAPLESQEKKQMIDYLQTLKTPEEIKLAKPQGIVGIKKPYKKPENLSMPVNEKTVANANKKLGDIMYGEGEDWKDPIKAIKNGIVSSENMDDVTGFNVAQILTEMSLMPDGFEAKRVLNSSSFKDAGEDNMTASALRQKAFDYDKNVQPLREVLVDGDPSQMDDFTLSTRFTDQINKAAIKQYASRNQSFAKELEESGLDINDPALAGKIPNGKLGIIVSELLSQPDTHTFIQKENPSLLPALKNVEKNILIDNPEYGINVVANKVSREVQKKGFNSIDPVFNFYGKEHKLFADLVAKEVLTPTELSIWEKEINNNQEKYMDAPSFFEGFASSGRDFGKGILNTFTEPFSSVPQTIKENWEKEAAHVSADPQGFSRFMRDAGHATGIVASIGATGNVLGGAGIANPKTASAVAVTLGFMGDQLEQGKIKYPDSPVKAWTSATFNTALYAALSYDLFPFAKAKQAFQKVSPQLDNVVNNLTTGAITREAARKESNNIFKKALVFTLGTAKTNTKIAAEMTGISVMNKMLDKVMGLDDFDKFHPEGEEEDVFKSMFLSNLFVAGMSKAGEMRKGNQMAESSLYEAASNPMRYQRIIEEMKVKDPSINAEEMLFNLKFVSDLKLELDGVGMSEKSKRRYIFESMKEVSQKQTSSQLPESNLIKKNDDAIKTSQEIKEKLLNGEEPDAIVTESEQKEIHEKVKVEEKRNKLVEKGQKAIDKLLEEKDENEQNVFKGVYRDIAKSDPMGFLEEIANQAYGVWKKGQPLAGGPRELDMIPKYGAALINAAKELFPPHQPSRTEQTSTGKVSEEKVGEDVMKDENGEPITFYHGTNRKGITELEPSTAQQFGKGIYFGSDKNADAIKDFGDGGKIFEVNLPSKLLDVGSREYSEIEAQVSKEIGKSWDDHDFPVEKINDEVKKRGYKGLIMGNEMYGGKEVMVFDKKDVFYKTSHTEKVSEDVKVGEDVADAETITVYHGTGKGFNINKKGHLFASENKSEAEEYAKNHGGDVKEFLVKKSEIADEQWVRDSINELKLKDKDGDIVDGEEYLLHELIDQRFDTALPPKEVKKLYDKLTKDGYSAIKFTDETLRMEGDIQNIVVFNTKKITEPKLPSPNETKPNHKATEPSIEGNEPIKAEKEKPVDAGLTEEGKGAAEGEQIRLAHADTKKIYEEARLPLRLETPTKHREQLDAEADAIIKKGYDFDKVAKETMDGTYKFEDTDQVLFARKVADLKAKQNGLDIKSKEFDAIQSEIEKLSRASDVAGTLGGRFLQSRKDSTPVEETISDFIITEKENAAVDTLTDAQKDTVQKEFNDIKAAEKAWNDKRASMQAEIDKLKAEKEFEKAKKSTKREKKDYASERKQIIGDILLKFSKGSGEGASFLGAKEIASIAPDVMKLVRNLVADGANKLGEVIDKVYDALKSGIPELEKKNIHDIIAGEYNKMKDTKNKLMETMRDLTDEASLINKLEALEAGVVPKSEKKKVERNREITELRKKIKEHDLTNLALAKKRIKGELEKVQNQLKTSKFSPTEKKEPIKLDKEAIRLRNHLLDVKQKRDVRLVLQERQKETVGKRRMRLVAEALNVPRTLMTIGDFSAVLRQNIFFTVGHPLRTASSLGPMFKAAFSQKYYDRWFADLKETPRYEIYGKSRLAITDSLSHDLSKREEDFMSSLAEKIPLVGRTLRINGKAVIPGLNIVKGSERSYTMLLNKMRVDMFNTFADSMEARGITFANRPKVYKAMAEYINNATGRSDFGESLNRIAPILNSTFFSPRLIASRVNMLTYWAQRRFWATLPREARIDYFRNWFSLLATGATVLAIAKLGGADVEDDPRSPDFGKIKSGNTRWDIWGGNQQYIRTLAQIISGEKKTPDGEIKKMERKDRFVVTPLNFLRNKLAPIPGVGVDIAFGETSTGDKMMFQWGDGGDREITVDEYIKQRLLPMTITGTQEAIKDHGLKALLTVGIPSTFGVGTQTYEGDVTGTKNLHIKVKDDFERTKDDGFLPTNISTRVEHRGESVPLTDKQKEAFKEDVEKERESLIDEYFKNNESVYGAMSDFKRKERLKAIESRAREIVVRNFKESHPELLNEIDEQRLRSKGDAQKQQLERQRQ